MEVADRVYLIDSFAVPGIFSTYFLDFEKKVLVEPCVVSGAKIVLEFLSKRGISKLDYIAVTHVHIDHGGSAATIAKATEAKILVHPRGLRHVANPEKLWIASKAVLGELAEVYGKPESIEEERLIAVEDGQSFDLGDDELIAIHALGHAPHMVAYLLKKRKILFPSDAVGMIYRGQVFPLTPPPFDFEKAIETLERFERLDVEIVALTHFGIATKEIIGKARDRLKLWFEVAKDAKSVEDLDSKLREVDEAVSLLERGSQFHSFYLTSLQGLLSAAKS